ncbi:MAG: AAA family ATPase, partial [Saprospiraceae bacterium]
MIQHIKIENYKSIPSLELDLGRVNVFIGENGSGKTNILEAVALGSAAVANKLDYQYLAFRGIRVVDAFLMASRFLNKNSDSIKINIESDTMKFQNVLIPLEEDSGHMVWERQNSYPVATSTEWRDMVEKFNGDIQQAINEITLAINNRIKDSHASDFLIFAPENYFL